MSGAPGSDGSVPIQTDVFYTTDGEAYLPVDGAQVNPAPRRRGDAGIARVLAMAFSGRTSFGYFQRKRRRGTDWSGGFLIGGSFFSHSPFFQQHVNEMFGVELAFALSNNLATSRDSIATA